MTPWLESSPRIVKGKPIINRDSDQDTGYEDKAQLLGIDLGTSRSSIVSMGGVRKTVETLRRLRPRSGQPQVPQGRT